jgi:hypothetical protein
VKIMYDHCDSEINRELSEMKEIYWNQGDDADERITMNDNAE